MSKKTKKVKVCLGFYTVQLVMKLIVEKTASMAEVEDAKDLIWKLVLLELHRVLMTETIDLANEYDLSLRHYQALALWQLLYETDTTDLKDDYEFQLFRNLFVKVSNQLKIPLIDYSVLDAPK